MGKQADLIMGAAAGYEAAKLQLFLQSLALVDFKGHVVLFVYRQQADSVRALVREKVPALDVELVVIRGIREYPKFIRSCIKRLFELPPAEALPRVKRAMLRFQGMPHVTRYFHYARYLDAHPGYSRVLLSDVRDVVFQADPFEEIVSGLYLGMEDAELTIATEPFDRDWVLDAYGEDMLRQIGDRQISCSGVTLGDAASIKAYIGQILDETMKLPFRKMKTRIYDQAFHNKLLHCGELHGETLCQPLRSTIATVGVLKPAVFRLTADGMLLNEDGRVAPIVHQYDRHAILVSAFEGRIQA